MRMIERKPVYFDKAVAAIRSCKVIWSSFAFNNGINITESGFATDFILETDRKSE